jgi:MFS family permease
MWFPGGIVIGSLISEFMTSSGFSWQAQMWVTMVPTLIYASLFYGKKFVEPTDATGASVLENVKAMIFSPVFIFLFACMALTAITEFGPQQWVSIIMSSSGASPMLILALTTGTMAIGRFFAGPVVKTLGQTGVLLMSAVFAAIGIYMFSIVTGPAAYAAAVIFAIGICYFWPVMIGAAAQRVPKSGALGMSIIGGVGMFSSSIFQPVIGGWIDGATAAGSAMGLTGDQLQLAAGQDTLSKMLYFPLILIVLFIIFFLWQKNAKPTGAAAH